MNEKQSVKKNYLYSMIYQLLKVILPLITTPYLSRVLEPDGNGVVSYTFSIVTYFVLFATLGTATYGMREIARHRDDKSLSLKNFWEIEALSLMTSTASLFLWGLWILIAPSYKIYYIILSVHIVSAAFDISWLFQGFEMYGYIVRKDSAVKLVGAALIFLLIKDKGDTPLYILLYAVTILVGNLSMWFNLKKVFPEGLKAVGKLKPLRHLRYTFIYFLPSIAGSVYLMMDKTMLGIITKSEEENGFYEQADRIIRLLETVMFALTGVLAPRMSYLFEKDEDKEIRDRLWTAFDAMFLIALPFMLGLAGVARGFVPWFFGKGYERTTLIIYFFCPLLFIICFSNILESLILMPSGRQSQSTMAIAIGAACNFILNMILIRLWGAVGAAVASCAAELIISCITLYLCRDYVFVSGFAKRLWKKLVAAGLMFGAVFYLGEVFSGILGTLIQVAVGSVIYFTVLVILKDDFFMSSLTYVFSKLEKLLKRN